MNHTNYTRKSRCDYFRLAILSCIYSFISLSSAQTVIDHGGQDWVLANGSSISGIHTNIGQFVISQGISCQLNAFDGANNGSLVLYANYITIDGSLRGIGAGYGGGGGGGGGGGADGGTPGNGGIAGPGTAGAGNGASGITPADGPGGHGGVGGTGAGLGGGIAGSAGKRGVDNANQAGPGGTGTDGTYGYTWPFSMGSGGGGGGGGGGGHSTNTNVGGGGGGGGGAGGRGGGLVQLYAKYSISITGTIDLSGIQGGNGSNGKNGGANGGNGGVGGSGNLSGTGSGGTGGARAYDSSLDTYSGPGGVGGNGGSGSGGALWLHGPIIFLGDTADIQLVGGAGSLDNGGTIAIEYALGNLTDNGAVLTAENFHWEPDLDEPNDDFANRIPISTFSTNAFDESFYDNTAANKESGEPNHAGNFGGHSLWWEWTASYSTPVTVFVDSANFDTLLAAYTGPSVTQLTLVASNDDESPTNLLSSFTFLPVAGNKYEIALDGKNGAVGQARIRVIQEPPLAITTNCTLAFDWADLSQETVSVTAENQIMNFGTATSGPLRLRFVAEPVPTDPANEITLSNLLFAPDGLAANQSATTSISGTTFPIYDSDWAYFIALEEQFAGEWLIQDAMPIPTLTNPLPPSGPNGGPPILSAGGNPGGVWQPVALTKVTITAADPVTEGQTYQIFATAYFNNNASCSFSNTVWTSSFPGISISSNGILYVGSVTNNTNTVITAPYIYQGEPGSARRTNSVINLPPPVLTNIVLQSKHGLSFTIRGVPNRRHIIEASTDLVNWVYISTNVCNSNGFASFADTNNSPKRFYRALELP